MPSSVMFLVALGTHSVFEGVAVGLQTKADKVLEFAVAVLVHEWVMAFTFGLEVDSSVLESLSYFPYILNNYLPCIQIFLGQCLFRECWNSSS